MHIIYIVASIDKDIRYIKHMDPLSHSSDIILVCTKIIIKKKKFVYWLTGKIIDQCELKKLTCTLVNRRWGDKKYKSC